MVGLMTPRVAVRLFSAIDALGMSVRALVFRKKMSKLNPGSGSISLTLTTTLPTPIPERPSKAVRILSAVPDLLGIVTPGRGEVVAIGINEVISDP